MSVGFCPFDDALLPNVTPKIKTPGSGGKQILTESSFLPMKCGKQGVKHLHLVRKI